MNRRQATLAVGGAVAAAAGAFVAWRDEAAPGADAGRAAAPAGDALARLWALDLPRPDGGRLVLAEARGRPLVVNFWASWCVPCVEEMPLLDRFHAASRGDGWQVVGLAVDGAEPVRRFLARQPVSFPVGLLGADGVALARALGNDAGGLPFSLLVDAGGRLAERHLGKLDEARLADWKRRAAG